MKRVRWLAAKWPLTMRQLALRLRGDGYASDRSSGFLITRVRDESIEAKFIEKWITEEEITDPFGEVIIYERTLFTVTNFVMTKEYPQVQLTNPSRSINSLASRLSLITDFQLAWEPLKVDVLAWSENLERLLKLPLMIHQIKAKGIALNEATVMDATFKSGQDVRPTSQQFLKNRIYQIDRLQATLSLERRSVRVQICSDGSLIAPESLNGESLSAIRQALPRP